MPGPLTSTHWGTYEVEVRDGRIAALRPFEHDPDPSPIGQAMVDVLDGPTRIDAPMVRKGWLENGPGGGDGRGREPFVEVSWDEAERIVAEELDRVRRKFGNQAIYAGSYGWASAGASSRPKPDSPLPELDRRLHPVGEHVFLRSGRSRRSPCAGRLPRIRLPRHELEIGCGAYRALRRLWGRAARERTDRTGRSGSAPAARRHGRGHRRRRPFRQYLARPARHDGRGRGRMDRAPPVDGCGDPPGACAYAHDRGPPRPGVPRPLHRGVRHGSPPIWTAPPMAWPRQRTGPPRSVDSTAAGCACWPARWGIRAPCCRSAGP